MENAILITSGKELTKAELEPEKYSRIYFGSEFCPHRIPTINDLDDIISFCEDHGKVFTLVTPYLSEDAVGKVKMLLNFLHYMRKYPEILISDWGMLHYIPENFGMNFSLVLGRILAKQKTGPRIEFLKDERPSEYLSSKKSHIDIPAFLRFLKNRGINRIELDIPIQGIDIEIPENLDISVSLYYPYAYISTTRRCPIRVTGKCDCQCNYFELSSKNMPVKLYTRGNTVFFKHNKLPKIPDKLRYDRLVFEPGVP